MDKKTLYMIRESMLSTLSTHSDSIIIAFFLEKTRPRQKVAKFKFRQYYLVKMHFQRKYFIESVFFCVFLVIFFTNHFTDKGTPRHNPGRFSYIVKLNLDTAAFYYELLCTFFNKIITMDIVRQFIFYRHPKAFFKDPL